MVHIKQINTCDMKILESEDSKHRIDVDGLNEVFIQNAGGHLKI